jgi:hypothetical protein
MPRPGTDATIRIERLAEPTRNDPLVVVIDPAGLGTGAGKTFWTAEARMAAGYDAGNIAGEAW